jgi:F-type H+-transporting ATPase subunit gamma
MVAMKAASDNAEQADRRTASCVYNKTRQAAITKELAEIVGGAARGLSTARDQNATERINR